MSVGRRTVLVCAIVLGVPAVCAMLLAVIVMTETGGRWILGVALEPYTAELSVGGFEGRLWDHVTLTNVVLNTPVASGTFERVSLTWRMAALAERRIAIDAAAVDGVKLTIKPPSSDPDAPPLNTLPAPPLPIDLRRFDLDRVEIGLAGNKFMIDHIGLGASWHADKFTLTGFDLAAYGHSFKLDGSAGIGTEPKIEASAAWAGEIADHEGRGSVNITGPINELRFESSIDTQVSAAISGTVHPFAAEPEFSLRGVMNPPDLGENLTLAPTTVTAAGTFGTIDVEIATEAETPQTGAYALSMGSEIDLLGATDDSITATVEWQATPRDGSSETIVGSGRVRFDGNALRIDHATTAPYVTRLSGVVDLDRETLDLLFDWSDIHHVISESTAIDSKSGSLRLAGPFDALEIELSGVADVQPVGPMDLRANGKLNGHTFELSGLSVALFGGTIESEGTFELSDPPVGTLKFTAQNLDLGVLYPDTPSRVNFAGTARLSGNADAYAVRIELDETTGYIRGYPLSGTAVVISEPGMLTIERARFSTGANRIDVEGRWGERMSGRFALAMDDLSVFDAKLGGRLAGTGTLAGDGGLPRINADLTGSAIRFEQFALDSIDADIDVDFTRTAESHAAIALDGLVSDEVTIGAVNVDARGNADHHVLRFTIDGPELDIEASASGAVREDQWRGLLDTMTLDSQASGHWTLRGPSEVTFAPNTGSITGACLESGPGAACITASRNADRAIAAIELTNVPLALADHFLPANLAVAGAVDGAIDLRMTDGIATGQGTVEVSGGSILREGGSDADKIAIQALAIEFELLPERLRANAKADIERWFTLSANVDAARAEGGSILVDLEARSQDIRWIEDFVPELSGSHGIVELRSKVSGLRDRARIAADLNLADGALLVPEIGLEIKRIDVHAEGEPSALDLAATIGAGDGTLTMKGRGSRHDGKNYRFDGQLEGSDFPLIRMPEVEADVSPSLHLVGDAQAVDISGQLQLPKVRVDIKQVPKSAVTVSDDQIIVDANGEPVESEARKSFLTDSVSGMVDIVLGDDISVNGFGLTSKLSGGVKWTKKRGVPLGRAIGVIRIDEGMFKAYGQQLKIENGRLQFVGPIDNPRVALQAVRPDLDIRAGVNVSGTAYKPKISLYSQPAMSDGDTLSYVVTGRGLDEASSSEAAILTQAALGLGADESAAVTNQIRNTFGLDELSVSSGETARDTSLVAGKRLSRKLSVRSGFNPFDQLWSFFLNYKLTPRWSVEAESGERQGADLLYSIEREHLFEGWFGD